MQLTCRPEIIDHALHTQGAHVAHSVPPATTIRDAWLECDKGDLRIRFRA